MTLDLPLPAPPCMMTKGGEGFIYVLKILSENVDEEDGLLILSENVDGQDGLKILSENVDEEDGFLEPAAADVTSLLA